VAVKRTAREERRQANSDKVKVQAVRAPAAPLGPAAGQAAPSGG